MIDNGEINKYFEVSAQTGEGFEQFSNILKIDCATYFNKDKQDKQEEKFPSEYFEIVEKSKTFQSKLNKYYDY